MNVDPHRATIIRHLLAEHRRLAQLAEQADDLGEVKRHLNAAWGIRTSAVIAIDEAERETFQAALASARSAA